MEHFPVEVVGNILSRIGAARDVVIASATCSKWREASCKYLHTLSFNSNDWPTTGLEVLYILMDDIEFSASTVISWLMYNRETLRQLFYNVRTTPSVNIIEIFGRLKLEMLVIERNSISGIFRIFPCLKGLSLSFRLQCQMHNLYVEAINLDNFTLVAERIECLHLKDCALEVFGFAGRGTLKQLKTDDVSVLYLHIAETAENLETIIKKTSPFWDMVLYGEVKTLDLETIAVFFPRLTHLSLCYDLNHGVLGWTEINGFFSRWVEGIVKRCPNLEKLVIRAVIPEVKVHEECQMLTNFTSSIVELLRKYIHLEVQFVYE
ncbi:hypothetical protein CIPAW_13G136300 [Carya illinoinensis]|uniref:F-box domain-containing protein n=1 Tax=Carya illinoinensis TaxID=32201 RepID=A0A8T1NSE5_CARIL|nr:hypothetical protein CIPAW_13G136300 [Carya illinoinensis]